MRTALPLFAVFALFTAACADAPLPTEDAVAPIPEKARVDGDAITVDARWREVSAGTATYGYDPRSAVMRIEVRVDDAAIRARHPGFDGLESAFVLVPRRTAAGLIWESHALPYAGQSRAGYFGEITLDVHRTDWVDGLDVEAAIENGIAVGLDTNIGPVWAQGPGENFPVVDAR